MEIGTHFPSFFVTCLNSQTPAECVILVIRLKPHAGLMSLLSSLGPGREVMDAFLGAMATLVRVEQGVGGTGHSTLHGGQSLENAGFAS